MRAPNRGSLHGSGIKQRRCTQLMITTQNMFHSSPSLKLFVYIAVFAGILLTCSLVVTAEMSTAAPEPKLVKDDTSIKPQKPIEPVADAETTEIEVNIQGAITDEYGHGIWATITLGGQEFTTPDGQFS